MKYYCPTSSSMLDKPVEWGCITEYRRYGIKPILEGRRWIADNGCFNATWERAKWDTWLYSMMQHQSTCDFVVLPDVVGDHKETLRRYAKFYPLVTKMGYKTAFACQDGCEPWGIPPCDALFIGGTTEFKMSRKALECIAEGRRRDTWVHIGRVNSAKRYAYFLLHGADSWDGTNYCFAPKQITKEIERWVRQEPLFGITE